ncbi:MAG: tetratricopeptide repeat protein [Spirochaetota bacterium]
MRRSAPRAVVALLALAAVASLAVAQVDDEPDALDAYRNGRFEEAIEITLQEIETNPNNVESYVVLGWALNALGRSQEAVDYGLRALQINQFESRVLQIIAEAHFDLGNTLEALQYLERYVQVAPTGQYIDWVYFAMGEIFIQLGEFHRADIAISTSVYHNSRNAVRWARLGYAREQLEEWEQALTAYDRALQLDPGLADAARGRQRVRAEVQG